MQNALELPIYDNKNVRLLAGDIIDIHQTVNGHNLFLIYSLEPLDIRYNYDFNRKYEYDQVGLLELSPYSYESEFTIIGQNDTYLREEKINKILLKLNN